MIAILVTVAFIGLLLLVNGLLVAAEFALVAAPRTRIAQRAEEGSGAARRALTWLRDPALQYRFLGTTQVGITAASLGLGMVGEHTLADWLLRPLAHLGALAEPVAHSIATVAAVALLTYLHVVLGEMVPKSIALQAAETTLLRLAGPMVVVAKLTMPVVALLNGLGNGVTRLLGVAPPDAKARLLSSEELAFVVEESVVGGAIQPGEQVFIENIFAFSDRTVGQVMTPRTRIVGLRVDAGEAVVLRRVCEARLSRYPVYERNLDHILGVLHVKDLARHRTGEGGAFDLRQMVRPALFLPDSLPLDRALARLRRRRSSVAIVFDEFGGTAGLVTLEDIVEEVVGEIHDEFDREIPPMEALASDLVRVRGDLILDELNQHHDLALAHEEAETVGGLIMTLLGRVVRPGDSVTFGGVTFEVERVEGLAIQTVLARLPRPAPRAAEPPAPPSTGTTPVGE